MKALAPFSPNAYRNISSTIAWNPHELGGYLVFLAVIIPFLRARYKMCTDKFVSSILICIDRIFAIQAVNQTSQGNRHYNCQASAMLLL